MPYFGLSGSFGNAKLRKCHISESVFVKTGIPARALEGAEDDGTHILLLYRVLKEVFSVDEGH